MAFDGLDAQKLTVNALYYLIANPGKMAVLLMGICPTGRGSLN